MRGHCKRHGVDKSDRMVELCQTDEHYWQAWESGAGPGQKRNTDIEQARQPKIEPQSVPEQDWPAWAKLLAARKAEADKGVGDTFQRLAASMGGEIFKKLTKSMGLPCGCDARQADWNRLYPYI
jgi:hypothetical protein